MSARRKPDLHLVDGDSIPAPGDLLRHYFAERDALAAELRRVDAAIAAAGRSVADELGVAFLRVEQLRQEFGGRS